MRGGDAEMYDLTATCGQDLDVRVEAESQHLALVPDHPHHHLSLLPQLDHHHHHHQDRHCSATSGSEHFHILSQLIFDRTTISDTWTPDGWQYLASVIVPSANRAAGIGSACVERFTVPRIWFFSPMVWTCSWPGFVRMHVTCNHFNCCQFRPN